MAYNEVKYLSAHGAIVGTGRSRRYKLRATAPLGANGTNVEFTGPLRTDHGTNAALGLFSSKLTLSLIVFCVRSDVDEANRFLRMRPVGREIESRDHVE